MEILAIAGGAALLSITALVGVLLLSFKLSDAKDGQRSQEVRATALDGKLAIATATIATKTNEAATEKRRADALDEQLAKAEQDMEADPRGALGRVLSHWKAVAATRATAIDPAGAVSPSPAPAGESGGHSGLLKPGE